MAGFVIRGFRGMRPILEPKLLEPNEAQQATDVRLYSGGLVATKGNETLVALKSSGTVQSIYRVRDNADETLNWFEFDDDADVALSPITGDDYGRVYWTGQGSPKYAPELLAFASGSDEYPRGAYTLGIPKPTVTPVATGSAVLDPATQTRYYVATYYNSSTGAESALGEEVSTKCLTNYVDNGTLYIDSFVADSSTSYIINFTQEHSLKTGDYIGITGSSVTGWNNSWAVSDVVNVKQIKIANTQTFPGSVPAGSYTVKKRYLPTAELIAIPSEDDDADVTHKRIYRKVGSTWYLLDTLVITTSEYTDTKTDAEVSAGTAMSSSVETTPAKSLQAPIASIAYDDTTVPDNDASATPVATVNRLYAVSYVDSTGTEGPLSNSSGIVTVIDGSTEVRVSHGGPHSPLASKKRIYRQDVTYTSGTYTVDETQYRLLSEVPLSQDVYIDTVAQSSIASNSTPGKPNALPAPSKAWAAVGQLSQIVEAESRVYVYTYVSEYGEEGPPSDPSTLIDCDPTEPVTVTTGSAPTGAYNITKKYIYRTSSGSQATDYQFVAEIPVATTSYTDGTEQVNLGEIIPSITWEPPPSDMTGLAVMANGIFAGFAGKDVCFSEAYLPHAWNSLNRLTVDSDIVGLGAFSQSIAVLTESFPYIISGVDPSAMTMVKTSLQQACISKRSIVEMGDGVIYASPDGLVMIGSGGVNVVTAKIMSQDDWQEYNPSSIHAYMHEGRYHAFYTKTDGTKGSLVFSLNGSDAIMVESTQTTTAGHVVPTADSLMIVSGSNIVKMEKDSSVLRPYTWTSKVFENPAPINFGFAQVLADSYSASLVLKVYADGSLIHTQTVTSEKPFRLPSGFIARDWYVSITGTATVNMIAVAQSASELKST